ncbi:MAG: TRAP transporter substrate-binding protein DctP [Pseudomonadota bacterium]
MLRKNLFHVVFVIAVSLYMMASPHAVSQAQTKKITLRAVSAWPTNDASVKEDFLPFVSNVNKIMQDKHPGQLEIKFIGGPEAIPVRDQPDAVRIGTVEMYYGTQAYYEGIAPAANIAKLTFLTPWEERESGAYDIFNQIHQEKLNAFYLGRLGNEEHFQLFLKVRVKKPEDLKGLRIRVSPMYIDFVKALGAIPIETKPGDIYQALERNVVDGTFWPFTKLRSWGFHEVTKYVVGPGIYMVCHPVLINLDVWKKIPDPLKKGLMEIMQQEERVVIARDRENAANERKLLKNTGMEFIEFSPEDTKKYIGLADSSGWEGLLKKAGDYGPKLRKALSK